MRCLLAYTVTAVDACAQLAAAANAAVVVHEAGTSTVPSMWDAPVGGSALGSPLISDELGRVVAWIDGACVLDLIVSDNGGRARRVGATDILSFVTFTEAPVVPACCEGTGAPPITLDHFRFAQSTPASIWGPISHGLGYRPAVSIENGSGDLITADVNYPDADTVVVYFGAPSTGYADLS